MAGVMSNAQIDAVTDSVVKSMERFAAEFEMEFLARVKEKTPVRTGKLQAGWEASATPSEITVWNDVEYAEYVENGTPFQAPQGMLSRTLEEVDTIMTIAVERSKR